MPNFKIAITPLINSFKHNSLIFHIFITLKEYIFHYMKKEKNNLLAL